MKKRKQFLSPSQPRELSGLLAGLYQCHPTFWPCRPDECVELVHRQEPTWGWCVALVHGPNSVQSDPAMHKPNPAAHWLNPTEAWSCGSLILCTQIQLCTGTIWHTVPCYLIHRTAHGSGNVAAIMVGTAPLVPTFQSLGEPWRLDNAPLWAKSGLQTVVDPPWFIPLAWQWCHCSNHLVLGDVQSSVTLESCHNFGYIRRTECSAWINEGFSLVSPLCL